MKTRPLEEVIQEIRNTFKHDGFKGVKGFSVTAVTDKSTVNIHWGSLQMPRVRTPSTPPVGEERE